MNTITNTPVVLPQSQTPNFKSKNIPTLVSVTQGPDYETRVYETDATSGKKWGVGLASAFIPGVGQAINGEWGKGIGFFLGGIGLPLLVGIAGGFTSVAGGGAKKSLAGLYIAGLAANLGLRIWSIVDAVKNAKSEVTQIVPRNNTSKPQSSINVIG